MKVDKRKRKVNKKKLDMLKIWWNLALENNDSDNYNKCYDKYMEIVGEDLEVKRYKKLYEHKNWKDIKMNDLVYIPELPLNKEGVIEYYYTKDDIVRICDDNKVIGRHVLRNIKGERVEDYFKRLKEQYYEWYMYEPTANMYKSEVSYNMFNCLTEEQKDNVLEVLDEKTGKRK